MVRDRLSGYRSQLCSEAAAAFNRFRHAEGICIYRKIQSDFIVRIDVSPMQIFHFAVPPYPRKLSNPHSCQSLPDKRKYQRENCRRIHQPVRPSDVLIFHRAQRITDKWFLHSSPKYQASPASLISSAPAQTDSVCAELGLLWLKRSLLNMRQAFL